MTQPVDPTTAPLSPILSQWITKHGPMTGKGYPLDPLIDDTVVPGKKKANPDATYRYTFADGSTLDAKWDGSIKDQSEVKPEKAAAVSTATGHDKTVWERGADGTWTVAVPGDETVTGKSKLDLAQGRKQFDEMEANERAGIGFVDNKTALDMRLAVQRGEIDENTLKQRTFEFAEKNKIDWAQERRLDAEAKANIGLTGAQTGKVGAETELTQARITELASKTPAEIEEIRARAQLAGAQGDYARGQLAEIERKAKLPTVESLGEGATYGVMSPTGQIEERYRQGYVPKTLGEVAARTGQLDTLAKQKGAEIQARVDAKTITAEQGFAEFNSWYDSNIAPQTGALEAAREEALYARGKEQSTQRQQALQQAQLAGNAVTDAYRASGLSRVGAGMPEALTVAGRGAGALKDVNWANSVFVPTDDPGSVANRAKAATDAAYQQVLGNQPQAAGAQYTPLSPQAELDRTRYMRGGPPPAAAPAPAAVPQPAAVGGPAPGMAPDLFHATPTIVNAQGHSEWAYPMDVPVQAEPEYVPPPEDYEAVAAPYQPPTPWAAPVARPPVRRRPMPVPMAAPVGNMDVDFAPGSLPAPAQPAYWPVPDETYPGPNPFQGNYVPPNYLYGGQYATPSPY